MTTPLKLVRLLGRARPALRALALTTMAFAVLLIVLNYAIDPVPVGCTILNRLPSPHGAWIAVLDEDNHLVGFSGPTHILGISLVPAGGPGHPTPMLSVETGGDEGDHPRAVRTAPDVLQVTVHARSLFAFQPRQVGPVHVDLRLAPPDPAMRAEYLSKMHRDPGPEE